jgi:hypothetical protein
MTPTPTQPYQQKQFEALIVVLTGRIGRCPTRNLDTVSLLDPVKLKATGAIMEYGRKHHASLGASYENTTSKVEWSIDARDPAAIKVQTSVGFFEFATAGHEPYAGHDPFWFRSRRHP